MIVKKKKLKPNNKQDKKGTRSPRSRDKKSEDGLSSHYTDDHIDKSGILPSSGSMGLSIGGNESSGGGVGGGSVGGGLQLPHERGGIRHRHDRQRKREKQQQQPLDNRPLEEFLVMINQWNINATSEIKKNPRTFVDLAGKCLNKYLTVNNFTKSHNSLSNLESATLAYNIICENSIKNNSSIQSLRSALNSCASVSSLLRQFVIHFIETYHTLCGGHFSHVGSQIDTHLRATYEALENELGWNYEEENDIFRSLPVRGEFPPVEFRPYNFEELETSFMTELETQAEKLNTLPALLRRLEGELVFRSSTVSIPDVDVSLLLNKSKITPGDLHRSLSAYTSTEFSKLFSSRAGNLFTAARASTCFLLQAQTAIDLLSTHPTFFPILSSPSQRSTYPPPLSPSSSPTHRHVLDLPKNLPHASIQQAPTKEPLTFKKQSTQPDEPTHTLSDLVRAVESRTPLKTHPRSDVAHACIAMFFDAPFTEFLSELEKQTRAIQLTQSPFFSSSLNFAPLFIHQDSDFLMEYVSRNFTSEYSQTFLLPSFKTLRRDEKTMEVLETINKTNSCGLLLAKKKKKKKKKRTCLLKTFETAKKKKEEK
eukprot:TRINITY_DN1385_c0_g2_i1.p1 TRINITY_DN1385_c0_g2~~TRINITY_DN1385_c0_g2_i1.p1  ORF type:complete len:595 (-),score=151.73 TRINITY_DN1385_c0_g2_i1:22-1806(-)